MTANTDTPTFVGTPDDWWHQATPITEAEAADRVIGNWYISNEQRSPSQVSAYRVATPNVSSNPTRRAALRRAIERGEIQGEESISPTVRRLIQTNLVAPDWLESPLLLADHDIDSDERVLWRRTNSGWQMVFDGRVSVTLRKMLQLRPVAATITEAAPSGE